MPSVVLPMPSVILPMPSVVLPMPSVILPMPRAVSRCLCTGGGGGGGGGGVTACSKLPGPSGGVQFTEYIFFSGTQGGYRRPPPPKKNLDTALMPNVILPCPGCSPCYCQWPGIPGHPSLRPGFTWPPVNRELMVLEAGGAGADLCAVSIDKVDLSHHVLHRVKLSVGGLISPCLHTESSSVLVDPSHLNVR